MSHFPTAQRVEKQARVMGHAAAAKADEALAATQDAIDTVAEDLSEGVDSLRDQLPSALDRAANKAMEMARRGKEQYESLSDNVRGRYNQASYWTVSYIKEEPIKAMLIATAVGAGIAWLVSRSRRHH